METFQEKINNIRILHFARVSRLGDGTPIREAGKGGLIADGERTFLLDCRDLTHVSSAGLGAFISCGKLLEDQGTFVFAGLSSRIEGLFEITGLTGMFRICKTKHDALKGLGVMVE